MKLKHVSYVLLVSVLFLVLVILLWAHRGHGRPRHRHREDYNDHIIDQSLHRAVSDLRDEFGENSDGNNLQDGVKMKIVGNVSVGEKVPDKLSRHIIIVSSFRSGTTFLGDLLNHYPGVFYYFEPLHYLHHSSQLNEEDVPLFLTGLLKCEMTSMTPGFLQHLTENSFLLKHNTRLYKTCEKLLPGQLQLCFTEQYLNSFCQIFPIKLVKTVRLRVKETGKFLSDPSLNVKIIFLVRDPRGVYASRTSMKWSTLPECADPVKGCDDLSGDVRSAIELHHRFPGQVLLVRYEDLSLNPEDTTKSLLNFLDLPWVQAISQYINSHTKTAAMVNPHGTVRNSSAAAFSWRKRLSIDLVKKIQLVCGDVMESLGYRLVTDQRDLLLGQNTNMLDKSSRQVWPVTQM